MPTTAYMYELTTIKLHFSAEYTNTICYFSGIYSRDG